MKGTEYIVLGLAGLAVLFIVKAARPAAAAASVAGQEYDAATWAQAAQLWSKGSPTSGAWGSAFPYVGGTW